MSGYRHLAALGSSFAAGPGIPPVVDTAARRSGRNYAHLAAAALGAQVTDLSVSGATTATMLERPQRVGRRTFPPQISRVPPDADLITITGGGNDLHYVGSLLKCAAVWSMRRNRWVGSVARRFPAPQAVEPGDADVQRTADGLARVVDAVRTRAPAARVVLVDYLTLLGPDTSPGRDVPLDGPTLERFAAVGFDVARAFERAAGSSGAELVQASAISTAHALGSAEPWVNGWNPRAGGLASSFHPNEAGMQAVADAVVDTVGR